jgi:hypothetical protein
MMVLVSRWVPSAAAGVIGRQNFNGLQVAKDAAGYSRRKDEGEFEHIDRPGDSLRGGVKDSQSLGVNSKDPALLAHRQDSERGVVDQPPVFFFALAEHIADLLVLPDYLF